MLEYRNRNHSFPNNSSRYLAGGYRRRNRRLLNADRLFEEWVTNYPIKLRPKLNPRRFEAMNPGWWKTVDLAELNAQWGGEVAAHRLTKHLKPATVTVYLPNAGQRGRVNRLVAQGKLRADPEGNTDILEEFWAFPADPARPDVVPPILIYADLAATLDPRNLEVARMIRKRYIDDASIRIDRPLDDATLLLLREVDAAMSALRLRYFLAGAIARDILLTHVFGQSVHRATADVDFAVAVKDWGQFEATKTELEERQFVRDNTLTHRRYKNEYPVDIIPFGGVES